MSRPSFYDASLSMIEDADQSNKDESKSEALEPGLRKKRIAFLLVVIVINGLGWFLAYFFKKELWDFSIEIAKHSDSIPNSLKWYFKIYGLPMKWASKMIVSFCLLFINRKPVALNIICISAFSFLITRYLVILLKDKRICFEDFPANQATCSCSFGMPSSQTMEITLMILLWTHEIAVKNTRISTRRKTITSCIAGFIILNVVASKVLLPSHTVDQAVLGAFLALLFFAVSLCFEDYLHNYFARFLYANFQYAAPLYLVFIIVTLMNMILWPFFIEPSVINFKEFTSARCFHCFKNDLLDIRTHNTATIQYNTLVCGVLVGARLLKPIQQPQFQNVTNIKDSLSFKGFFRCCLMAVLNLPLLLVYQPLTQRSNLPTFLMIYTLVYFAVGFNLSFLFTVLAKCFRLNLEGDLERVKSSIVLMEDNNEDDAWYFKAR